MVSKILIMISGRGSNMEAIINSIESGILRNKCEVVSVFSNKKDALGLSKARGINIKIIESKGKKRSQYNSLLLDYLSEVDPDYIILAGYMKIIPAEIIRKFKNRIINIHPADTALHQGLNGYQWAWENKLDSTKVTVHFVDDGLDTGKIIGKSIVDLNGADSLEEVEQRGLDIEHIFYSECLLHVFEKNV